MIIRFALGVFAVSLVAVALPCKAAEWNEVDDLPSVYGMRVFVDDASYQAKKEIRQAWVRMDYAKPREREGQTLISYVSHRIVNCDSRRYLVTESWGYVPDKREPVPFYSTMQEWQLAVPNSEADIAIAAICHEPGNDLEGPE